MEKNIKSLEELIRAAKPESPGLPGDFSQRVMEEITVRRLAILPARRVTLRRRVCLAAATLLLGAGILLVNGVAFEVQMNGSFELLFFGLRFLGGFLTRLPFDLLVAALLLSSISAWLFHYGRVAPVALTWALLVTYGITGAGGLALAQSGLNEQVRDWATEEGHEWPMLAPYFRHRAHYGLHHPGFRMGRVVEVGKGAVRLLTPGGEEVDIGLPAGLMPKVGDHLRLRGARVGGRFNAEEAQIGDPRRIKRYFHHMDMAAGHMKKGDMMPMGSGRRAKGSGMGSGMGKDMRHMGGGRGMDNSPPLPLPR